MASLIQEREVSVVYGSEDLNSGLSSEKLPSPELPMQVQGMANSIYSEFQRMMSLYGEDVIKQLMPLIVTILEALDRSLTECNESAVEIEMLRDDNEQLATQFDRERQLRRTAEQQYMESEDHNEAAARELRAKTDSLETTTRRLQLKCQNFSDQVDRLQEREAEMKREFKDLHDRHAVMIQNYMDLIERTKVLQQQQSFTELSQSPQNKRDLPLVGQTPSPGDSPGLKTFTPDSNRNLVHTPVANRNVLTSTPGTGADLSSISLKEELPKSVPTTPVATRSSDATPLSENQAFGSEHGQAVEMASDGKERGDDVSRRQRQYHKTVFFHSKKSRKTVQELVAFNQTLEVKKEKRRKALLNELPPTKEVESPSIESDGQGWVSAEVKEILQNGELDLGQITPEDGIENQNAMLESTGIENAAFDQTETANESSLFAELSQQDIVDVDEGADILAMFESGAPLTEGILQDSGFGDYDGMSKEVQNLINENTKLLATKNALNVVKDDLIEQVDQLTTQHTLLKEELKQSEKSKCELQEKLKELEKQLHKLQEELNNVATGATSHVAVKRSDEDEAVPLSQRKRFTRVEMARVLMERNQYKERLMELQEAVRWTETLRASRAHPDVNQSKGKNKSTIFQFFSRLFTSNSSDPAPQPVPESQPRSIRRSLGSGDVGLNMAYNVPTSKIMPRSRSTQMSLYGRSPTIDTLREEPTVKPETPKREIQARMVDSRFQACGWSLPNSPATPKEGPRTVPVPVFCGPLLDAEPNMKLWCGTAVNVSEGRTKDGGSIVGSGSVFYDTYTRDQETLRGEKNQTTETPALCKLDEEIENQTAQIQLDEKKRNALSSFVWLVAGDARASGNAGGNTVSIMDACQPNRCIDRFSVGTNDTNILCITSIPGADVEDFNDLQTTEASGDGNHSTASNDVNSSTMTQSTSNDEVATEATEDLTAKKAAKKLQNKGVTEHVFTDPASIHPTTSKSSEPPASESPKKIGSIQKVQSPLRSTDKLAVEDMESDVPLGGNRLTSLQPTMWLGAQNGYLYVHSAISNWRKCLHQIRLKDSVLAIVYCKGKTLAALADGTVAFFTRNNDGVWNLANYHLLDLGKPHHSIRCMAIVYDHVWCAYRNRIHIVEPKLMKIQSSFDAHPRRESQVRQLAWAGDGVWISIRLDSTVRLYHARTLQHLQDVDVEPYVSKVLGSGKLGFSFVRITSLMTSNHRLWIGTGNGVVMSVPLSEARKQRSISRATTLERHETLLKYQDKIAECGVKDMKCLLCSKTLKAGPSSANANDCCVCKEQRPGVSEKTKKRTTKMSKRAGLLLKVKFFRKKGAKTSTSTPVLSSSVRDKPGGVVRVYSDPISEKITPGTFIPYCSMANAQLSFHGYRDAVKFFIAVPGCVTMPSPTLQASSSSPTKSTAARASAEGTLVLCGGEGYVDFRKGDLGAMSPEEKKIESAKQAHGSLQTSHVIVWQLTHS